ncbi:MAG: hypothetical protein B6U95_07075 [Thermofilum sp. ex4484_82]|nr:MAG: hypothetical protein B6U95_07075 [Thermofilum sp. ex4484_82]OYT37281.1 MAG: hypothetical protein B6U96_07070 [Archaeoglobales archaeon ex4484_92]
MIRGLAVRNEGSGKTTILFLDEEKLGKINLFSCEEARSMGLGTFIINNILQVSDQIFDKLVINVMESVKKEKSKIYRVRINSNVILIVADELKEIKVLFRKLKELVSRSVQLTDISQSLVLNMIEEVEREKEDTHVADEVYGEIIFEPDREAFKVGDKINVTLKVLNQSEIDVLLKVVKYGVPRYLLLIDSFPPCKVRGENLHLIKDFCISKNSFQKLDLTYECVKRGNVKYQPVLGIVDFDDFAYSVPLPYTIIKID